MCHNVFCYIISALCTFGSSVCCAQGSSDMVSEVVRHWDSAAAHSTLWQSVGGMDTKYVRESLLYEIASLQNSLKYKAVEDYIAKSAAKPSFMIRVTERVDHVNRRFISKGDSLISVYDPPVPDHFWWIIGRGDGSLGVIYPDNQTELKIVDTSILCSAPLMDSLKGLDRSDYTFTEAPGRISIVSIWSPDYVSNVRVFGLLPIRLSSRQAIFNPPLGLVWVAKIIGDLRCAD